MKRTATMKSVELIPRIEVYERRDSGMKTVGIRLVWGVNGQPDDCAERAYIKIPHIL